MKVVYIGVDVRTSEIVTLAVHLRWPDVTPQIATSAGEGMELIERELPDIVILHPDFTDLVLRETAVIQKHFRHPDSADQQDAGSHHDVDCALPSRNTRPDCDRSDALAHGRRKETTQEAIVQKQDAECDRQDVEEIVVARSDDADLEQNL